jgi:hypothetical protein
VPRPRSNPPSSYSHGQASYVLDRLISDRRISPGEVARYINDMQREINDLERRLEQLRAATSGGAARGAVSEMGGAAPAQRRRGRPPGSANRGPGRPPGSANRGPGRPPGRPGRPGRPPGSGATAGAAAGATAGSRGGRRRARAAITAEQLASRQLQGRYLGLIRQIPASKRGQYQRTAKEKGREAAIREMQGALGK